MKTLKKRSLFWDVATVDLQENKKFIIERILNYGDEDDFRWAMQTYGSDEIKEILLHTKALDDKSLVFWCQYFNLDDSICLKNQSVKKQSWFWKR